MDLEIKKGIPKGRALKLLQKDISRIINANKNSERRGWLFESDVAKLIQNEWGIKIPWWEIGYAFRHLSWLNEQTDIFKYGKLAKKNHCHLNLSNVLSMVNYLKLRYSGKFLLERYDYLIKTEFLTCGLKDGNWDVRKLEFIKNDTIN